jgi:hypothetical protein
LHILEFWGWRLRLCNVYYLRMVRIREILDPDMRQKVLTALAERRGCTPAMIPEWFELDDADFVDLLQDMKIAEAGGLEEDDSRM